MENTKEAKKAEHSWPGFMWSLFCNEEVLKHYGIKLWKFVPKVWRYWWIDEVRRVIGGELFEVTIDHPAPYFIDRTDEILRFNDAIGSYSLPKLRDECNNVFLPNILCPFGCTEFRHKFGCLSLDIIFQRFFRKCFLKLMNPDSALKYVESAREDYIRGEGDYYDYWLMNYKWQIHPSIAFVGGVPYILTCREHNKGTQCHIIHPPRQPFHNLPSKYSDQLCHCCIKTRTVKPLKRKTYSNGYQMHEQRGTFNGVDTCNLTTYRQFGFRSKLLSDSESRSIIHRPDINSLLSQMVEEGDMSQFICDSKRKLAEATWGKTDVEKYYRGSTYVPFRAAISMQRDTLDPSIGIVSDMRGFDDNGNALPELRRMTKKFFPSILNPCQKMDRYGAMPVLARSLRGKGLSPDQHIKTSCMWSVMSLILSVQELWSLIGKKGVDLRTSDWYGWYLLYCTRQCLSSGKTQYPRNDFFTANSVRSVRRFYDKVHSFFDSTFEAFDELDEVLCIDLRNHFEDSFTDVMAEVTNLKEKKVVLVEPYFVDADGRVEENICVNDVEYELRVCANVQFGEGNKSHVWDSMLLCRHGGYHNNWWYSNRMNKRAIHCEDPSAIVEDGIGYLLAYVQIEGDDDMDKIKKEYTTYLGAQSHVYCEEHSLPFIQANEKSDSSNKCPCGRNVHLTCPKFDCCNNICKKCFDDLDAGMEHKISCRDKRDEQSIDSETEGEASDDEDKEQNLFDDGEGYFGAAFEENERGGNQIQYDSDDDSYTECNPEFMNKIDAADDLYDEYLTQTADPDFAFEHGEDDDRGIVQEIDGQLDFEDNAYESTNAGEVLLSVNEDNERKGHYKDVTISGCTILNQCGSLLTRQRHQIKGRRKEKFFLQKINATSKGKSIPLLYPEAMLFPSIFYMAVLFNVCSIAGAIPSPLLSSCIGQFGFASIPSHARSRLTNASCATSTDYRYVAFLYDMLVNLAANHEDTRLVLQRGLTVGEDRTGGLGLRGKSDSCMSESLDSMGMVRKLCAAMFYHAMDYFLTFTCNQRNHFGTKPIKEYLDSGEWKKAIPFYEDLDLNEKEEFASSVEQSASGLLLRVWEEVSELFLNYLLESPSSPYRSVSSIFARKEYQALAGNLSHIHLMLEVNWSKLNDEQKKFVEDLTRCSVLDIVRPSEVHHLIDDGTYTNYTDWYTTVKHGKSFLGHKHNSRCVYKKPNGDIGCKKQNYLEVSKDNTRDTFMEFNNELPEECLARLEKIGMIEREEENENGYRPPYKSKLDFLHPKRHIPATNPNDDINMSPCEGYTFANCCSMQNIQKLSNCGGANKYVCKYITKIDEQNYIVVWVDKNTNGQLITKSTFLHNTKVSTTKISEDKEKEKKRGNNYPQGRCVSHMEMFHLTLRYPEVHTNLNFETVPTTPLELRAGIALDKGTAVDSAQVGTVSNDIRVEKNFPEWRQHTYRQMMICEDLKVSHVSVDKITVFSLRPPELLLLFDTIRNYFRWFIVKKKKVKPEKIDELLNDDLYMSIWLNNLQQKNMVGRKALPEIMSYFATLESDSESPLLEEVQSILSVFKKIDYVLKAETLSSADRSFRKFALRHLVDGDDKMNLHLPVPVFSYIKPTNPVQFLHHILLSMGHFSTEIDLTMHGSIRECLRNAKLIGEETDRDSLVDYSNRLLYRWIEEQLQYFHTSRRVFGELVVTAGELFDSVIIDDEISINDIPPVQLSSLFASTDEGVKEYANRLKADYIDAILMEVESVPGGENELPTKEQLMECTKSNTLGWNAYEALEKFDGQSEESHEEQKLAVKLCTTAIDKYCSLDGQRSIAKNIGIRGFPGSGKTWCSLYCCLYALSKGLFCLPTAVLAKRAIQLGGTHWHSMFCIIPDKKTNVHRKAELAVCQLMRDPQKLNVLRTLDVLFCDEIGQLSAEFIHIIDIILKRVRGNNMFLGGLLIISTLDHTQIQSINSRPFLTHSHIIPCFKMVCLNHSVRAFGDEAFQRLQYISRLTCREIEEDPNLEEEFIELCSNNLTFVNDWDDPAIGASTMRLYSKKVPARVAAEQHAARVQSDPSIGQVYARRSDDYEKSRYSQQEWYSASETTSNMLDKKVKEPRTLLFYKGGVYICTFNKKGSFSQSQMALLYDLPDQDDLQNFKPIRVLLAPPGIKSVKYEEGKSKESYIAEGYKEVKIGIGNTYTQGIQNNMQCKRKQYGLKLHVSATIHAAMGDTLEKMATSISSSDPNFNLWDKGQLVVKLSRTKKAKDSIFVGSKTETLRAFRKLLKKKNQWSDYIEEVLSLVTVNNTEYNRSSRIMTQRSFPFKICDVSLPQCMTGYVYFLVSIRFPNFSYIGTTIDIRSRLQQHNSGHGSIETVPAYRRPYALLAYICGFGESRRDLRYYVERKWKEKHDELIWHGVNDVKEWATCGNDVIRNMTATTDTIQNFGISQTDLTLVCVFE